MSLVVRRRLFRTAGCLAVAVRLAIGLFLLWQCPCLTFSARAAADPQPYRIDDWQVEQGLPQSSVTSIVQTRDGYLWLGTFNGLARFDGVQFKVFNPNNSPGLPGSRILQLFEDRQGALWIGTEEGSVARYAAGHFETLALPGKGNTSGFIRGLGETDDGTLWVLTSRQQLLAMADGRFTVVSTNENLQGNLPGGLAVDGRGHLWISTEKGVARWQGAHLESVLEQDRKQNAGPAVIAASRLGGCWIAAEGRVRRFDGEKWAVDYGAYPWTKGDLYCMMEDRGGQLWMGTYGSGVFRYDTNGALTRLSTREGLPGDLVRSFFEDREGNVWVGMEGNGLGRIKPALFRAYGRHEGLSGDCVLSVCEGADGELWIGTNGDGINRLKAGVFRHYGPAEGLFNECVWSIFEDRQKTLWAGTWGGGLFRMEGEAFSSFANAETFGAIICALFEDADGGMWVGAQRSNPQIMRLRDGQPLPCTLQGQPVNADVRAVAQDAAGALWIGTQGDGLYRVAEGRQTHFGRPQGLSSEIIRSLYADKEGVLWIGTYGGGLDRLERDKIVDFTTQNGLVNDALCYITEDGKDNLWCGSLGGVFRVAKAELNRVARGEAKSVRCFGYTTADGLPSLECSGGCQPSGCKTRDGRLWFPTIRGLAVVDPENVPVNPLPPPVVIEDVVIDGKAQSSTWSVPSGPEATLKVPPGSQRLEFQYTGLSLTAPRKVQFEYKLEGLDEQWVDAGTRRSANFSHLRPATYRFRVRACNNDGVWNETGASLGLVILPYYWQTWWFRSLAIAALLLLFVAVYEIRLASQRRMAGLRLRIARDLHDEVGSNLGSIALLSEMMPRAAGDVVEESAEIRRIAVQTIGSLRDIVWFLDPASDDMEDLVLRMKDTAKTMLPGIAFEFSSEGTAASASPSLELRRNVFPMFKEILHNIAKHARATRVEIRVRLTATQFEFRVADDGVGFDEARVRPGNGLKNLRRRAADLRAKLDIHSLPGKGTQVVLTSLIT